MFHSSSAFGISVSAFVCSAASLPALSFRSAYSLPQYAVSLRLPFSRVLVLRTISLDSRVLAARCILRRLFCVSAHIAAQTLGALPCVRLLLDRVSAAWCHAASIVHVLCSLVAYNISRNLPARSITLLPFLYVRCSACAVLACRSAFPTVVRVAHAFSLFYVPAGLVLCDMVIMLLFLQRLVFFSFLRFLLFLALYISPLSAFTACSAPASSCCLPLLLTCHASLCPSVVQRGGVACLFTMWGREEDSKHVLNATTLPSALYCCHYTVTLPYLYFRLRSHFGIDGGIHGMLLLKW